jgi:hypothetical protein
MSLSYLERKKSTIIKKIKTVINLVAGQSQALFLLVIEDNKY